MARSQNQKTKLIHIVRILEAGTDEDHPMKMGELIAALAAEDISAERKALYKDIALLKDIGYDICYDEGRGYYMAGRDFEVAECKLLVDAVNASKFITAKKSKELIGKLEKFVSRHEAQQLRRQVVTPGRIKNENEAIYYYVDTIHRAIQENRQISFPYRAWDTKKNLVDKHDGKKYIISPWTLVWSNEYYYLLGYDHAAGSMKYFRVDKIGKTDILQDAREGKEAFDAYDMAAFSTQTFGMSWGEPTMVTLSFPESLVGVLIDRFGKDIVIMKESDDRYNVHVKVRVSHQFFGWVAGIGKELRIVAPVQVKDDYKAYLQSVMDAQ